LILELLPSFGHFDELNEIATCIIKDSHSDGAYIHRLLCEFDTRWRNLSNSFFGALETFAGDHCVRVVIVTGGAPGYFNRHFDIPSLIRIAEDLRASGREWPENATYNGGFFDKAMALCETMPKPVIAAISGTAIAGAFEFTLACDLRVAEDGDYLLGLPEVNLGLLPGAGGTQR
jgi:enoyl-CoA hydratase/carnithine racemase